MSDRYDSLQPPHIISTLRSMPRRWKSALYVAPPKDIDELFGKAIGDHPSAAEHSGAALAQLTILFDAIRTTGYSVPEPLGPEVQSALADKGSGPWPADAAEAIQSIGDTCEALADRLDALAPADWMRSTEGITVNDLARGAARVSAERLRQAERMIERLS